MIGDLFSSFDFSKLPDKVNEPTYHRLCTFLRSDLHRIDLVPERKTVRQVVEDVMRFNTSGTLCWLLGGEQAASDVDSMEASASQFGYTQRIFARCAKAVFAKVEAAAEIATQTGRTQGGEDEPASPATGEELLDWLTERKLQRLEAPLHALDVCSLEDLFFGVKEGFVTQNELINNGASKLAASRLITLASPPPPTDNA